MYITLSVTFVSRSVPAEWVANRAAQPNLWRLVSAYTEHGHRKADLDPLKLSRRYLLKEGEGERVGGEEEGGGGWWREGKGMEGENGADRKIEVERTMKNEEREG